MPLQTPNPPQKKAQMDSCERQSISSVFLCIPVDKVKEIMHCVQKSACLACMLCISLPRNTDCLSVQGQLIRRCNGDYTVCGVGTVCEVGTVCL